MPGIETAGWQKMTNQLFIKDKNLWHSGRNKIFNFAQAHLFGY
jgi:hypothetical protein